MTRETKARKGQGYTLNAKEANLKYEGEMVIYFHFISTLNANYNVADYT